MTEPRVPRATSRLQSFRHAGRGLRVLFAGQPNARIHLVVAVGVVLLGAWLRIDRIDWALLALAIGLVIGAEALNTAVEHVVDLASPRWHALARDAKDVAAAGVLVASLAALAIGLLVFVPRLLG
ncbi:MAG: diacylglycerol kinase family protein [Leptothrix sp. (in: b-proteobacteria)]